VNLLIEANTPLGGKLMVTEARLVLQHALGIVFLLSATAKARDPGGFARGVMEYKVLPRLLSYCIGLVLLPLEAFVSASHLTGWRLDLAVPLGLVLLLSFVLGVGVNLGRGRVLPCYCFGSGARGGETISGRTVARLLLLLSGEVFLLVEGSLLTKSRPAIYPWQAGGLLEFSLAVFWAGFALLAGSWLLSFTDLLNLLRVCNTCGKRRAVTTLSSARGTWDS